MIVVRPTILLDAVQNLVKNVRHPMVRGKTGSRDYGTGDSPVCDVFAKSRSQVVKRFLLTFGHYDYVASLRKNGRIISQPERAKVSLAAMFMSNTLFASNIKEM